MTTGAGDLSLPPNPLDNVAQGKMEDDEENKGVTSGGGGGG